MRTFFYTEKEGGRWHLARISELNLYAWRLDKESNLLQMKRYGDTWDVQLYINAVWSDSGIIYDKKYQVHTGLLVRGFRPNAKMLTAHKHVTDIASCAALENGWKPAKPLTTTIG